MEMSNVDLCSNIIKQVNINAENDVLFTSDIGLQNGVTTRSRYFCLKHSLWAWRKGVNYDKNEVAKAIKRAFQDVNLSYLKVSKDELTLFCKNINRLNTTFEKGDKFDQSLTKILYKMGMHVLQKKPTRQAPLVSKVNFDLFKAYFNNHCTSSGLNYASAKNLAIRGIKYLCGDKDIHFCCTKEKVSSIAWAIKLYAAETGHPFTNGITVFTAGFLTKHPELVKEIKDAAYTRGSSHYGGRTEEHPITDSGGYGLDVKITSDIALPAGMRTVLVHPIDTPVLKKNGDIKKGKSLNAVAIKLESYGTENWMERIFHLLDYIKKKILHCKENLALPARREDDFPEDFKLRFERLHDRTTDGSQISKIEAKTKINTCGIAYIYHWCTHTKFENEYERLAAKSLIHDIKEKYGEKNLDIRKGNEFIIDRTFCTYFEGKLGALNKYLEIGS